MFALMTNKEIYRSYLQQLQQLYSPNEAATITDWVFEKIAGLHRADIIKNPTDLINPETSVKLNDGLISLLQHKPVQYVLGEAWFYKMKLKVNDHVLIPRPETEELVQLVSDEWHKENKKKKFSQSDPVTKSAYRTSVIDIGTGSGCIAIAVKKNLPEIDMLAIDVSSGALSIANENANLHEAAIEFKQINFLDENSWEALPVFDIIISNPPYIPINEKEKLDKNVTDFEPHTALFVPDNTPFLFYEKIAAFGKKHLSGNGKIYVEIHEDFAKETSQLFDENYIVELRKDFFGKERMLIITPTFSEV
jgi:release factor glutamine methyltransferase